MSDSRIATREHIEQVRKNICEVISELSGRGLRHDASKLVSPEVEIFDEFTPKLRDSTYGSDEYKGFLTAMGPALDHHYANNNHHPEYFAFRDPLEGGTLVDADVKDGSAIRRMSLIDIIEMLCDWNAATKRHADGDIRKSIEINQKRYGYGEELKTILLNTLKYLDLQGGVK